MGPLHTAISGTYRPKLSALECSLHRNCPSDLQKCSGFLKRWIYKQRIHLHIYICKWWLRNDFFTAHFMLSWLGSIMESTLLCNVLSTRSKVGLLLYRGENNHKTHQYLRFPLLMKFPSPCVGLLFASLTVQHKKWRGVVKGLGHAHMFWRYQFWVWGILWARRNKGTNQLTSQPINQITNQPNN